jgi:hypothetical protein
MATAGHFRRKADQCRRLAGVILTPNDPTGMALLALAVEYDHKATSLEAGAAGDGSSKPVT